MQRAAISSQQSAFSKATGNWPNLLTAKVAKSANTQENVAADLGRWTQISKRQPRITRMNVNRKYSATAISNQSKQRSTGKSAGATQETQEEITNVENRQEPEQGHGQSPCPC
jgi:hypothetical protein